MRISFKTADTNYGRTNGYGVAANNIVESLYALGHRIVYDDENCRTQLNFCQPEFYSIRPRQYTIGYTPWESTELRPGWKRRMLQCQEIWTTSEWCKKVFEDAGIPGNIYVYEHGIEPMWKPRRRVITRKLKFLHIGEPAPRKGAELALNAFRAAFGDSDEVELTIKAAGHTIIRNKDAAGNILGTVDKLSNVRLETSMIQSQHMPSYYNSFHALIYPSYGEGFGFIPLQALATGMPSVVTTAWCPYKKFVLPLNSKLIDSPWPQIHPGKVYEPDFEHLVMWYKELFHNYETYSEAAFKRSARVHAEYNWEVLTQRSFQHLIKKNL